MQTQLLTALSLTATLAFAGSARADTTAADGNPVAPVGSRTLNVPAHGKRWWTTPSVSETATVTFDVWVNGRLQPDVWSSTPSDARDCTTNPTCYGDFEYGAITLGMFGTRATGPARFSVVNHTGRRTRVKITLFAG